MRNAEETGVLFDLDGVLIDSEGAYTEFWAATGEKYHADLPDFARAIKGTTLTEILSHFAETDRDAVVKAIHDYEDEMVYPVFEGVERLLDGLRRLGIPTAIVTSSDNVKMASLYKQQPWMESAFTTVITGSMVEHSKPDPEGYLKAARAIGRRPECCFVFEDSMQGLEAGRRAGATVVGIATTNPRRDVARIADIVVDSIAEITAERLLGL